VTDPREPLYGKRFRVESVSRSSEDVAHVFVCREDGIVLRVPLRATSLSTLVNHAPRAKLCRQAAQELLDLVKEYELCPPINIRKPAKSGRRSIKKRDKKSKTSSVE
jgi:hypothetical protein